MRVSAVIKTKKGYLLFHRFWKGNEYYCTPGGHVEKEEKPKDALVRECFEELGVKVKVGKKIFEIENNCYNEKEIFYECSILEGILGDGKGEEFKDKKNGKYNLEIVKNVSKINLLPEKIKLILGRI
ncbi:NUDIX domain-containing protein [Candidatus Woesearchaeota archaeon]|nr:NUDIX domain-containing protein [Candidatus Woesearchaeota archaeon]